MSAYADMGDRVIKALSPQQVADLREGRGMGASLPAELNGVPGPLHVLELKAQLEVSPEQQVEIERITSHMRSSAQALGAQVLSAEAALDEAFRSGTADEKSVLQMAERIGSLNGELRAVHLLAHLETRRLLSAEQVLAYNQARGYAKAAAAPGSHAH
jgi:hypothetical protein